MGIADWFYGRSDKARARRADKIRAKYSDFPGMTPELLEPLAATSDVPSKEQVELYLGGVPAGAVPTRVLTGLKLGDATFYAASLFESGVTVRWGARKAGELAVQGADLPFWGMQKVAVFSRDGDDGVLVSGRDGNREYSIGFLGVDPEDVKGFAASLDEAWQKAAAPPMKVSIDSSLPAEQQLAALEQMRQVGAIPDDVYDATVAKIRASAD